MNGTRGLTDPQSGIWYAQRLAPASPVFNLSFFLELHGSVDTAVLRTAIGRTVGEDDTTRLRFVEVDGEPRQEFGPPVVYVPELVDLTAEADPRAAALALMRADQTTVADPIAGPQVRDNLFRHILFRLSAGHHLWYSRQHHLVHDGHSQILLWQRAADVYSGLTGGDGGVALGLFRTLLDERDRYLGSADHDVDRDHWRRVLADAPRPEPVSGSHRPKADRLACATELLDEAAFDRLVAAADAAGVSWRHLLVVIAVLHRRSSTGASDVLLGLPMNGRTTDAARAAPGMTATVLPLRVRVDPAGTIRSLATEVADTIRTARRHQRFDPAGLVRELGWNDGTSGFGPVVNLIAVDGPLRFGAASAVGDQLITTGATEDVTLTLTRFATGTGLRVDVTIDESRCAAPGRDGVDLHSAAAGFVRLLNAVGDALTADADSTVDGLDTRTGLDPTAGNNTAAAVADRTLAELFAEAATAYPDTTAVVFDGRSLTYRALEERSNRLARHLTAQGVRPGQVVAVLLERGIEFAVALLAVVKAGAGYTVLDPDFPDERMAAVLADAAVGLVVTDVSGVERLPGGRRVLVDADAAAIVAQSTEPVAVAVSPSQVACVMFTSGSTGRPKGVVSPHRALVGTLLGQQYADFGPDEVFLQCSPVSWDAFSLEFWGSLVFGGTCVLQPGQRPEPAVIARLAAEHQVTMLQLSSSLFNYLVDEHLDAFAGVRLAFTGGETASAVHVARILTRYPTLRVVNGYGPVESMGFTTTHPVPSDVDGAVPVGRPVVNKRVYVLDTRLRPVPEGVLGEVYLGGVGLATGYAAQPDLSSLRFLADPFAARGERMYRTGDLARWTADGVLEFAGRVDDQVKIRGFRVEPGEVAAVIARHGSVGQVAVVVDQPAGCPARLVGYVVGTVDPVRLREWLRDQVPDHLVPAVLMTVDRLPMTANGKLDRTALPAPELTERGTRRPRNPAEEILCGLFADVLGIDAVGIDDRFFDLGGHSLLAARLVARIGVAFGVELGLREVFAAPTVAELALAVAAASRRPDRPVLTAGPAEDRVPLAPTQRGLWFLDRMPDTGTAYNVPLVTRVDGPLDVAAFTAAVIDLVGRHEVLRTVYQVVDDEPCQRVLPVDVLPPLVHRVDGDPDAVCAEAARYRFDLDTEAPIRVSVIDLDIDAHLLVLVLHHIATDGMSLRPLFADLAAFYAARLAGDTPQCTPLPVRYADWTRWQHALLADPATDVEFWQRTLADLPAEIALPRDRARPAIGAHRGGEVAIELGANRHALVRRLAAATGATPFMVLQAALATTLTGLGAGTDVPIGTAVAGRTDERLDQLVGMFVNTVVLRTDTGGDPTFRELVSRVRAVDLDAYAHQGLPFDRVLDAVDPVRSLARHPLFQVCLTVDEPAPHLDLAGVHSSPSRLLASGTAKFDLEFLLTADPVLGITGKLVYDTELFDPATARRILTVLTQVLDQVLVEPDRPIGALDLLPPAERALVLSEWNGPTVETDEPTLGELFAGAATTHPDATALAFGTERLSYRDLSTRANRLAHHLIAAGVRPGAVVGVLLDRGIDFAVTIVAVVTAGAGYTVLDPEFPDQRLAAAVTDTDVAVVVTTAAQAGRVAGVRTVAIDAEAPEIADRPGTAPDCRADPDDVACVMFTSGSTGRPKGVLTAHRAVVGTLLGQDYADFGPSEVFLQCSPVSWDAFSLEFWGALGFGGTCVLHPGQRPEPAVITRSVAEHGVTMLQLSSSLFNHLVDEHPDAFVGVRLVFTGGEAASATHVARALARHPDLRVVNGYGPAESMGFTTTYPVPVGVDGSVPIGRPIANKRVYVLDGRLRPVPIGVTGEVHLAGVGLASGYAGRPDLTTQRFLANPFGAPGERMYRTGDLARWTAAGVLEFAGRVDDQVKIRGFRVEPGEVVTLLQRHEAVAHAAVLALDGRLVAYVVADIDARALREWVADQAPEHMVPSAVVLLDRLPFTANGKLDRTALPAPEFTGTVDGRAPRDQRDETLCGLFREVLDVTELTIDDRFFDLGGHSLLAARLISRIRTVLHVELTIRDVFQAPTVAELADRVGAAARPARRPTLRRRTQAGAML